MEPRPTGDNEHFDIENMARQNGEDPGELGDFIQSLIKQGVINGAVVNREGRDVFMLAEGETFEQVSMQLMSRLLESRSNGQ